MEKVLGIGSEMELVETLPRPPLVDNHRSMLWVTRRICGIVEGPTPLWWWGAFFLSTLLALIGLACMVYLVSTGVGVWGLNHPVGWAWDITNFVFWIGIGHAGTLISAILFLTRQKWRTSISRAAEAMTLFAVICAGIFPGIHVGRFWMIWYMVPLPNSNGIWPNFRSPLMWDFFAVSTYFTVSVLFWFVGMIPDLATMRERATHPLAKWSYGLLALGWHGGNRQWRHYEMAYLLLAGLATPLVLSVHSVVSFDFAASILPGWHSTIFPPYFVAGAIFGGLAMVLTLLLPARRLYGLHDLITPRHIDVMCKLILLTGSMVAYAYGMELFTALYGNNSFEHWAIIRNRLADPFVAERFFHIPHAPYWWAFWTMIFCNVLLPQVFWFQKARQNIALVFLVCLGVNVGMWFERFVIIVTSLHRDFLPSAWGMFRPTWVDIWTFLGTIGIFLSLFLLFIRFLPMIAMSEVKRVLPGIENRKENY